MGAIHVVGAGECLSSIARQYGFTDWRTIYEHPDNAEFRKKRPNPNLIFPGDEIRIPDREEKTATAGTGRTHRFRVRRPRTLLRIRLEDERGEALGGRSYSLEVEGDTIEGRTRADGLLEERVSETAKRGRLTVWLDDDRTESLEWTLFLGLLDPEEELSGVQARLNNLGFHCGPVDGLMGPKTREALCVFQGLNDLPVTGEADGATRAKLAELHDGG